MHRSVLIIFFAAGFLACGPASSVSTQLQEVVDQASTPEVVRIADLTGFPWESLVIFGPYTTQGTAEAVLGFPWPEFERFGLASADGFSVLVFVQGDSVVAAEKHARCKPDFAHEALAKPFRLEEAVFTIDSSVSCPIASPAAGATAAG